jgi:hypothetical protein
LEGRASRKSSITVAQINKFLDELSLAPDKGKRGAVLKKMLHETTALMQKWIVRIILKDLKVRLCFCFLFLNKF